MDLIKLKQEEYILIVAAKRTSVGQAMKQCLLAMKDDMHDTNGDQGSIYGFVTTGKSWRMVKYI